MQLRDAIGQYLLDCKVKNISSTTIDGYAYWLKRFVERVGDMPISEVSSHSVRSFIAYLMEEGNLRTGEPLSSHTIHKAYRVVGSFSNWLVQEELVVDAPTKKTSPPRVDRDLPDALTHEELLRIFDYLETRDFRDKVIFEFFLDTGCRLQEVVDLTIDDIHLTEGWAKIFGKGRREAIVPMGNQLCRDLHTYIFRHRKAPESERALFVSTIAPYQAMTRDGISSMIKRVHKACGIEGKYGPHKLRHTMATQFITNGGDIAILRRILRHTNISVTQRYINLVQSDVQSAHKEHSPLDRLRTSRR
jgi:integrase/recombinase XerD